MHRKISIALIALAVSFPLAAQTLDAHGPGISDKPAPRALTLEDLYAEATVVDSAISPSAATSRSSCAVPPTISCSC